jgi:hypothetical protein
LSSANTPSELDNQSSSLNRETQETPNLQAPAVNIQVGHENAQDYSPMSRWFQESAEEPWNNVGEFPTSCQQFEERAHIEPYQEGDFDDRSISMQNQNGSMYEWQ